MPIRTGGLATGIDTQGLIKQLVSIERIPVNKLKYEKKGYEAQLSTIGRIKSSLLSLKSNDGSLSVNQGEKEGDALRAAGAQAHRPSI